MLKDHAALATAMHDADINAREMSTVATAADECCGRLDASDGNEELSKLIERVDLKAEGISVVLGLQIGELRLKLLREVPLRMKRRGVEMRMVIEGAPAQSTYADPVLISALSQAHRWADELTTGKAKSMLEIAKRENVRLKHVQLSLPLAFLAPPIVEAILNGTQPVTLTTFELTRRMDLAMDWDEQRRVLGVM